MKESNFIASIPFHDRVSMAKYVLAIFTDCLKLMDFSQCVQMERRSFFAIESPLHVAIGNPYYTWKHTFEHKKYFYSKYDEFKTKPGADVLLEKYPNGTVVYTTITQSNTALCSSGFNYYDITDETRQNILKKLCDSETSVTYAITVISSVFAISNSEFKQHITCQLLEFGFLEKLTTSSPTYDSLCLISELASYSDRIKPRAIETQLVDTYLLPHIYSQELQLGALCCIYNIFRIRDSKNLFDDILIKRVIAEFVNVCIIPREKHYPVTNYCIYFFSCLSLTPKYRQWIQKYDKLLQFLRVNRHLFKDMEKHVNFILTSSCGPAGDTQIHNLLQL